jgi:hypothetical protein
MTTFIHQLTSGIAGWLTFEQMRKGTDNLRESELAKPLELIAQARGFEMKGEFPIKGGRIDFLLVHREKKLIIAIETKYKKAKKRMKGSLGSDALRLSRLSVEMIEKQIMAGKGDNIRRSVKGFELERAVLVIWKEKAIIEQLKIESKIIENQFFKLMSSMLPNGTEPTLSNYNKAMLGQIATKAVAKTYGSVRSGSMKSSERFWVASFMHQSDWSEIVVKKPRSLDLKKSAGLKSSKLTGNRAPKTALSG